MIPADSAPPADRVVTQRARMRTMLERRKRLWRRIVVLLGVTTVMVLAALWNRDQQQLRAIRKQAALVAAALQENYTRHQDPPLSFPKVPAPYARLHDRYYFNMLYANQQKWTRQAGVCCLREPLRFFLRTDGRMVILFDGEQFSPQWMTEGDFRANAPALGFASLLKN